MLESIKNYFFERSLRKSVTQRNSKAHIPFRSISVLFNCTEEPQRKMIEKFSLQLRKKQKQVSLLGFFNHKLDEDISLSVDYYSLNDLNWYGKPKSEYIDKFVSVKSDLLLNLISPGERHHEYIMAQSKCPIHIASHKHNSQFYDIAIEHEMDEMRHFLAHTLTILQNLGIVEENLF